MHAFALSQAVQDMLKLLVLAVIWSVASGFRIQLQHPQRRTLLFALREEDVDARDVNGETPLILSSEAGDATAVRDLLARGADPNAQSLTSWTALHGAAEVGSVACVELLVAAGARMDARAKSGMTPVEIARKYGRGEAEAALARLAL